MAKKTTAKKAKKSAGKKPAAKKASAKKAPAKAKAKGAAKKGGVKKAGAKKPVAKKTAKAAPAPKKAEPKKASIVPPKKPQLAKPKNATSLQFSQAELYDSIAGYCGFASRRDAKEFYGSFTELLQQALKNGYKVALPGLGKLQVRKTKARTGINPMTREPIKIPARKKVAFTANKALKDAVL